MPASLALNWFDARLEAHEIALKDALEDILAPDLMAERTAHPAPVAQHA
jgi:biopolymer transport protein ExbB